MEKRQLRVSFLTLRRAFTETLCCLRICPSFKHGLKILQGPFTLLLYSVCMYEFTKALPSTRLPCSYVSMLSSSAAVQLLKASSGEPTGRKAKVPAAVELYLYEISVCCFFCGRLGMYLFKVPFHKIPFNETITCDLLMIWGD